jgi:hypothetical protein
MIVERAADPQQPQPGDAMILEKNKKPGVCYAMTDDGVELPVMDITNPVFAESIDPERSGALARDFLKFQKSPAFFRRIFNRRSIAMRGMDSAANTFLGGMTTYVAKLGPGMLGRGYSGWVDRKVAGAIGSVSFRLRLQDTAHLLAEELAPQLAARKAGGLHLINIGGGPAMDSLNALILIRKEHPERLTGRRISIHVLDLDRSGPSFGSRAAAALLAEGAPLQGLDIAFEYVPYDWADGSGLRKVLDGLGAGDIVIGSSEGGLFEYGSDGVIAGNLLAIREEGSRELLMVGSIFREGTIAHWIQTANRVPVRTFELADFKNLAASAGWAVRRVKDENPLYQIVSLGAVKESAT